jgi:hypothetical protein
MSPLALWRAGQRGWPRHYPLVQLPNAPLLLALAGRRLRRARGERTRRAGGLAHGLGMSWWALAEITRGANPFRRALGIGALVALLASRNSRAALP